MLSKVRFLYWDWQAPIGVYATQCLLKHLLDSSNSLLTSICLTPISTESLTGTHPDPPIWIGRIEDGIVECRNLCWWFHTINTKGGFKEPKNLKQRKLHHSWDQEWQRMMWMPSAGMASTSFNSKLFRLYFREDCSVYIVLIF